MKNHSKHIRNNFNNWISKNFKGLSAFTLVQLLKQELSAFPRTYIEDSVYVDLFNLFTGKDTSDDTQNVFNICVDIVASVEWL